MSFHSIGRIESSLYSLGICLVMCNDLVLQKELPDLIKPGVIFPGAGVMWSPVVDSCISLSTNFCADCIYYGWLELGP